MSQNIAFFIQTVTLCAFLHFQCKKIEGLCCICDCAGNLLIVRALKCEDQSTQHYTFLEENSREIRESTQVFKMTSAEVHAELEEYLNLND